MFKIINENLGYTFFVFFFLIIIIIIIIARPKGGLFR